MFHKALKGLLEIKHPRLTVHNGEVYYPEGVLHRGKFIELVYYGPCYLVLLKLYDDPHPFPVRLIPQVRYPLYLLVPDKLRNLLNKPCLVDLVRELSDYYRLSLTLLLFNDGPRPHLYDAAASRIGLRYPFFPMNKTCRREVGARYMGHQARYGYTRIVYQVYCPANNLSQIVWRDIGSHAHGNTA